MRTFRIIEGDALKTAQGLPDESVQCVVTSPPYFGLRDYGIGGQLGLEKTPERYVAKMVEVFREARRVMRDDGTLWLNLGDSYAGYWGDAKARAEGRPSDADRNGFSMNSRPNFREAFGASDVKPKDLIGLPWMVAFALRADGWYLRQEIIWHKPNPMPESVTDRCTKAHESIFLLSKSPRYYFDADAIKEPAAWERWGDQTTQKRNPGTASWLPDKPKEELSARTDRNKRSVWTVPTRPFSEAHFAVFPPDLIEPCVLAGSKEGGTVYDPFTGSGTTGLVALRHGRNFIGSELNPDYCRMARNRIAGDAPLLNTEAAA